MENLDLKRAKFAAECVEKARGKNWAGEYKSLVKGFPGMIMTNGLGQALAFLSAKGKNQHNALYSHLRDWHRAEGGLAQGKDLLDAIINGSEESYRLMTGRTMALLNWMKKMVEAKIEGGE